MTLQSTASGGNPLTINEIKGEFGYIGSNSGPNTIASYRRGAGYVPNHQANANIPSSGTVRVLNFLGADRLFKPAITSGYSTVATYLGNINTEGYESGVLGSATYTTMGLSVSSLATTTLLELTYVDSPGPMGLSTVYTLNFKLSGNTPTWTSLVINGTTFTPPGDFGGPYYDSVGNTTLWRWRGAAVEALGGLGGTPSITINI